MSFIAYSTRVMIYMQPYKFRCRRTKESEFLRVLKFIILVDGFMTFLNMHPVSIQYNQTRIRLPTIIKNIQYNHFGPALDSNPNPGENESNFGIRRPDLHNYGFSFSYGCVREEKIFLKLVFWPCLGAPFEQAKRMFFLPQKSIIQKLRKEFPTSL